MGRYNPATNPNQNQVLFQAEDRMSACTALANCPGPGHHLNITAFDGLQGGVEGINEDLLASVCSGLVCGGRGIGLLVGHQLLCLEPFCQKEEIWPEWARPATCVTIALTALILFSLVYFGKSWSDGRVKGSDRRRGRGRRVETGYGNGNGMSTPKPSGMLLTPKWDRLKTSVLTGPATSSPRKMSSSEFQIHSTKM